MPSRGVTTMELIWVSKVVMTEVLGRCTKRFVPIAKRNARFLSNQEKTVRFFARTVFQNTKTTVVNSNEGLEKRDSALI